MAGGRPRKISFAKNRSFRIYLSEKAFFIFQDMNKKRGGQHWIHDYVSTSIIRDFEINPKFYLINRMRELEVERNDFNNRISVEQQFLAQQIGIIKDFENEKQAEIAAKKELAQKEGR